MSRPGALLIFSSPLTKSLLENRSRRAVGSRIAPRGEELRRELLASRRPCKKPGQEAGGGGRRCGLAPGGGETTGIPRDHLPLAPEGDLGRPSPARDRSRTWGGGSEKGSGGACPAALSEALMSTQLLPQHASGHDPQSIADIVPSCVPALNPTPCVNARPFGPLWSLLPAAGSSCSS